MNQTNQKGFIKNIVVIIIILLVVFFSQQAYFRLKARNSVPQQGTVQDFLTKSSNWIKDSVYPRISGEVEKRGEIIKNEVNSEKEKVSQTIGEKIKNYFSGISDSIFNPGKSSQNNCPPADAQAQP